MTIGKIQYNILAMYYTYSVILNIGYPGAIWWSDADGKDWAFCSGLGATWQSNAGEFSPLTYIETSAVMHILPPGG